MVGLRLCAPRSTIFFSSRTSAARGKRSVATRSTPYGVIWMSGITDGTAERATGDAILVEVEVVLRPRHSVYLAFPGRALHHTVRLHFVCARMGVPIVSIMELIPLRGDERHGLCAPSSFGTAWPGGFFSFPPSQPQSMRPSRRDQQTPGRLSQSCVTLAALVKSRSRAGRGWGHSRVGRPAQVGTCVVPVCRSSSGSTQAAVQADVPEKGPPQTLARLGGWFNGIPI